MTQVLVAHPGVRQPRKYEIIWTTLKEKRKVTLEVHPAMVERVKKAVIKEKDMDLAVKLINDIEKPRLSFCYSSEKKRLVVELKMTYGLVEMKV